MEKLEHCPLPWKVAESVGGKVFMYDANGEVVIKPNVSATGRKPEELVEIYNWIVQAVNARDRSIAQEEEAWTRFDELVERT